MIKQFTISLGLLLCGNLVFGSSGEGIPTSALIAQIGNLSVLVAVIFITQRKTVVKAFADKKESFVNSVQEASASKKQAQATFDEVSKRLDEMKATFAGQIEEAKTNALESYRTQVADAKNEAVRVRSMTQTNLDFEIQRQVENLRVEAFRKSATLAEKNLEKSLTPEQLKAWNTHFTTGNQGAQ